MANACVLKKFNKRMLSSSSCESEDSSTNSSSDSDSFDEEAQKRATYHEWRSYLMKIKTPNPYKAVVPAHNHYKTDAQTPNPHKNGTSTPNPYKAVVPAHNYYRTDAPTPSPLKIGTPAPNHYRTDAQTPNPHKNGTSTPNPYKNGAPTPSPYKNGEKCHNFPMQNTQSVFDRIKATSAAINPIRTVTQTQNLTRTVNASNAKIVSSSLPRIKPNVPASRHIRTVVPAIKKPNAVPPTSRASQTQELSASLRSLYETFWSLNSAAKLVHVKSQLDEPSKIYVHKLIKAHSNLVQENSRLKKEKQDLINVIKKIQIAISNEMIANLLEPARSTQPKNS